MGKLFNKGTAAPQQAAQEVNSLDIMSEAQTSGAQAPAPAATPQVAQQPVKGNSKLDNFVVGAVKIGNGIVNGAKRVAKVATIGLAAYGGFKLVQKFKGQPTSVENTDDNMTEADECISTAQEDHAEEE